MGHASAARLACSSRHCTLHGRRRLRPATPRSARMPACSAGLGAVGVPITADLPPLLAIGAIWRSISPPLRQPSTHVAACVARARAAAARHHGAGARARGARLPAAAAAIALLVAPNTSLGIDGAAGAGAPSCRGACRPTTTSRSSRRIIATSAMRLRARRWRLGAAAARARGVELAAGRSTRAPGAAGPRSAGRSASPALRGGDVVGEHAGAVSGPGRAALLLHSATDRAVFARGALRAGQWLAAQPAGTLRDE